ncbi:alpha/beta hydrolase family protein [Saccharopolyspora spinosa]|nr:prolyl oligopeptidase family serine peptidase [Saccharopolyspora spinosa]
MTEMEPACRPLKEIAKAEVDDAENKEWVQAWSALGSRVEALGDVDAAGNMCAGATRKYLRAAAYSFVAEVMRPASDQDPEKMAVYDAAQRAFRKGIEWSGLPIEFVDVPFEGATLPAIFVPGRSPDGRPAPCMVHFDGKDDVKEVTYLRHRQGMADRGISLLIVDHPGSGAALRKQQLYARPDIEVAATAAVDYLETRSDVDMGRIGIIAQSMGGYYAPRSAAFEKRFKACVVWGAAWDLDELCAADPALEQPSFWKPLGPLPDTAAVKRRLADFKLSDHLHELKCALLVFHGEHDVQVPLWTAERTYERAINASSRELRVFTEAEGGAQHCQADMFSQATDLIADWSARFFGTDAGVVK